MMTTDEEQVTFQSERVAFDLFVVFSEVDPGPRARSEVRNDLSADAFAEISVQCNRQSECGTHSPQSSAARLRLSSCMIFGIPGPPEQQWPELTS